MTTKQIIGGSLAVGFVLGLMITGLAIMAATTDDWYKQTTADTKTRVFMIDCSQEQTVTAVTFKGKKLQKIEDEY